MQKVENILSLFLPNIPFQRGVCLFLSLIILQRLEVKTVLIPRIIQNSKHYL